MANSFFRAGANQVRLTDNGDGTFNQATDVQGLSDGTDSLNIFSDGTIGVRLPDSSNIDAFGRLRVSNPTTVFDNQVEYGLNSLIWNNAVTGSATVTSEILEGVIRLENTTLSGDKAVVQSKKYIRYQPGKSQLCAFTGNFRGVKENVVKRIGYFDEDNGMFFEVNDNGICVVIRKNTTGTVVESRIYQADWNLDKLDGTGDSGFTLDITKSNIFFVEFQALYVGRVRFGFDINGEIAMCHQVLNAGNIEGIYIRTANLPIRYEMENISTVASATSMSMICTSVLSEGGQEEERAITHHVGTEGDLVSVSGTRVPIISIRSKQTFSSITNRAAIIPIEFSIYAETRGVHYEILYNATTLTTATWTSGGDKALIEYDTSSTTVAGGEVLYGGFLGASNQIKQSVNEKAATKIFLTRGIDPSEFDTITIVALGIGGNASVGACITVKEVY